MIHEVEIGFDDYDEQTLSIVCPDCRAAITARCLADKPGGMGGKVFLPAPHRNRVVAAHKEPESIWGF
jgi:hypothetical protein